MPDQPDLRTQITDVLQTFPSLCALGEQYVKSVADALLSELGLTRETRIFWEPASRYVTEWVPDA